MRPSVRKRWCKSVVLCLCLMVHCCWAKKGKQKKRDPTTIVVYLEGVGQWMLDDPSNKQRTHGFRKIQKTGIQAEYLLPEFPTVTPTNYFSLFTGLYPEHHGVYGNILYDQRTGLKQRLDNTDNYEHVRLKWNNTAFVWEEALDAGVKTSMYYARICPDKRRYPSLHKCLPHKTISHAELVQFVSDVLEEITTIGVRFILIDIDLVAVNARKYGATAHATLTALQHISNMLYDLQTALASFNELPHTNLLVLSDHGLINTSHERYSFIDDYITDPTLTKKIIFSDSYAWIYPNENKTDQIHQVLSSHLPHCHLHWTNQLPSRWRLATLDHSNLAPLLLLCDPGYGVSCRMPCNEYPKLPSTITYDYFPHALDGYDNAAPKMKGILMGTGPDFYSTLRPESWLRVVDVRDLMCRLLRIKCRSRNSDIERVADFVIGAAPNTMKHQSHIVVVVASALCWRIWI